MNIKRVYVTKIIGVHIDSHLNWCEHINHIKSKMSKNVSIMRRVKHLLIHSALYSLYSTLVMPYLNYCCDIWGNTYKSRIQPLHIPVIKKTTLDPNVVKNYRPITISSVHTKAIESFIIPSAEISDNQYRFRENRGTAFACNLLNDVTSYSKSRNSSLFLATLDAEMEGLLQYDV